MIDDNKSDELPPALDVQDHLRDDLHKFQPGHWGVLKRLVASAWEKGYAAGIDRTVEEAKRALGHE